MSDSLKIALAQIDPHVGQIDANLANIRAARAQAALGDHLLRRALRLNRIPLRHVPR